LKNKISNGNYERIVTKMKKILIIIPIAIFMLIISINTAAQTDSYRITASETAGGVDIIYMDVLKNQPTDAYFTLKALTGATAVNDVLFYINVQKPDAEAIAVLIATDTNGNPHDVAALGFWGPPTGFPISAATNETTEFTGTFDTEGQYRITVDLKSVSTGTLIASKTLIVNVYNELPTTAATTINITTAADMTIIGTTDYITPETGIENNITILLPVLLICAAVMVGTMTKQKRI